MDDAAGAANLLLKLFELRTEPALRQARAWFAFEFHPSTTQEVLRTWLGPGHESAPYRMVTSYWDMGAEARIGIFGRYMERQRALAADGKQRSYLTEQPLA